MEDLTRQNDLTGEQIDELSLLYRQSSADLASLRSDSADPDQIRVLSVDIARARARLTGTTGSFTRDVSHWFRVSLPVALYQIRWVTIAVTAFFLAIVVIEVWWILSDPSRLAQMGTPIERHRIATRDFVDYYSQDTSAEFGASVWVNNTFVTVKSVITGITGILPLLILLQNAVHLGGIGAIVISEMGLGFFLSYLLPHGLPEMTAIFIGVAAGLQLFWALVNPGPSSRMDALAKAGRAMVTVALGLVILLFISGVLEGFITPSALPVWLKISLGAAVTVAVWLYTFVVGGRAARQGFTADVLEGAGYSRPAAG